jgi:riboflavin synthase
MFTGIIRELGKVQQLTASDGSLDLTIVLPRLSQEIKRGDSIAINGVCLTATSVASGLVRFDVMLKTLEQSMLKTLRHGQTVNAEPAIRAGDPLGGHWVQGHVDGTGIVKKIAPFRGYTRFTIEASETIMRYCVPQGSIAVSGVSLTLADVLGSALTVSVIPTTLADTTMGCLCKGDIVNLEVDILGKYVYHYLAQQGDALKAQGPESRLSEEFLRNNGF